MQRSENNRVLSRTGARHLTEEELRKVQAALGTTTVCTAPQPPSTSPDGDPGEYGHLY